MKCLNCSSIVDFDAAITELLSLRGSIDVLFEDGETVLMPVRRIIFHLFYWRIARKWQFPITKKYVINDKSINSDSLSKIGTLILRDVIDTSVDSLDAFKDDIWKVMNDLMNFILINCQEYHQSINIVDMCRLSKHPDIVEITSDKVRGRSSSEVESEKKLKRNQVRLFNAIKKIDAPWNTLRAFSNLKFIGATQLAHIFYQIGFRTDINDDIIAYPITSGYLDGLANLEEYAFESVSAKKAVFYNRVSIPESQYFNRGQHLALACLPNLHRGDCGSVLTVRFHVTKRNRKDVLWKNILDGTRLVLLTDKNIDKYVDKVVKLRSPLTCKFSDGTCEVCAGRLMSSIRDGIHVGIASGIKITNVVVQKILSSKHFQNTTIIEYNIPKELSGIFALKKRHIFVKPAAAKNFNKTHIGIPNKDAIHLIHIAELNLEDMDSIAEDKFGRLTSVVLKKNNNQFLTDLVPLATVGKRAPLFSKAFVKYIRKHNDLVYMDNDMFWVPMDHFDVKDPVFKIVLENDSMIEFVNNFAKFLKGDIRKCTTIDGAFTTLIELINRQVNINVAYAELVLKTYLVTSEFNPTCPVVKDPDNVQFNNYHNINLYRNLGATLAYEQLHSTFLNPLNYLCPRSASPFDSVLNLKPMIDLPVTDPKLLLPPSEVVSV